MRVRRRSPIPFTISDTSRRDRRSAARSRRLAIDSALCTPYGGGAGYLDRGRLTVYPQRWLFPRCPGPRLRQQRRSAHSAGSAGRSASSQRAALVQRRQREHAEPDDCRTRTARMPCARSDTGRHYGNAGCAARRRCAHMPRRLRLLHWSRCCVISTSLIAPFIAAADYKLYWGAAGKIDSVIDVTQRRAGPVHARRSVELWCAQSSAASAAGSFDARAELTAADFACVKPV